MELEFKINPDYLIIRTLLAQVIDPCREDVLVTRPTVDQFRLPYEHHEGAYATLRNIKEAVGAHVLTAAVGLFGIHEFGDKIAEWKGFSSLLKHTSYIDEIDYRKNIQEVISLFEEIRDSTLFSILVEQTQRFMEEVQAEWEFNYDKSHSIVKRLMGEPVLGSAQVYISHPAVGGGHFVGGESFNSFIGWGSTIGFGYQPLELKYKNYSTVYLWHEALHVFGLGLGDPFQHAVVELFTDNALRIALNGGQLFPLEGHPKDATLRYTVYNSSDLVRSRINAVISNLTI